MKITFKGIKDHWLYKWFTNPVRTKKIMLVVVAVVVLAVAMTACGTTVKVNPVETQVVDVPVAQPCPKAVDPTAPPKFPADDADMKNLPYPAASAALKVAKPGTVAYDVAKGQVDANVYYLLQIMAADRLVTRSWIDKLSSNLKVCQSNG